MCVNILMQRLGITCEKRNNAEHCGLNTMKGCACAAQTLQTRVCFPSVKDMFQDSSGVQIHNNPNLMVDVVDVNVFLTLYFYVHTSFNRPKRTDLYACCSGDTINLSCVLNRCLMQRFSSCLLQCNLCLQTDQSTHAFCSGNCDICF